MQEKETCKHEILEPVLCRKCKGQLVAHEEEILGAMHEIAGYCPNEECEFYKILIA